MQETDEAPPADPASAGSASDQREAAGACTDARLLRRRWRELIKRIYEVDPLVCPRCQAEMRIVAFILDPEVIATILRHLARKEAERNRGPPGSPARDDAS